MKNIRSKHGYHWSEPEIHTGFGSRQTSGFVVDNLDTKKLEEATSSYEKAFIISREVLKDISSYCLDNDEERLQCCQDLADALRRGLVLK